jgi:PAS domain S-box-containing protein
MSQNVKPASNHDPLASVAGGGEMGRLIRAFDWSKTPLGPVAGWPQSLRSALGICLDSNFPIALYWGSELVLLYNDSWSPIPGEKHPWSLGRPAREAWADIWHLIAPLFERVMTTGEPARQRDQLLPMHRHGYTEECYFDYTFSPVRGAAGVEGVFNAVIETTDRVIGERRLRTLRELAADGSGQAQSAADACAAAARVLAGNPHDLPFALIYLLENGRATLVGRTGLEPGGPSSPTAVDLDGPDAPWPFRRAAESGRAAEVECPTDLFGVLPGGAWPEPSHTAVVLPLAKPGQSQVAGFVVAGVNSRRPLDDAYRGFLGLLAGQVATAVATARAYEDERRRAEQLAELDRAKTAFFSNVSHEFRTPLTLMLGPVEDLLARAHTDLPPAAAGQLEVVNRNGLRLLRLVNSLLDFSRIEAGRVRAVFQPTDLAAFTADLASNFRAACERAGLRLVVDCPPLSEPAFVDREMWEKVVLNLVSNAFKFTFEGEIAVSLRRSGGTAELRVRDTGTGIPAEEMPKLFERFHRIENARGRTHEGSGIGLALVQELVKLHGGSVAAESVMGGGTTFTVTVPLGSAHLPPDQIGDARTSASTGTGATPYVEEALRWLPDEGRVGDKGRSELPIYREALPTPHRRAESNGKDDRPRVLVADDNADMRQYVARLLAEQFRVDAVPDGEAALTAVRREPPDLVLTDVMMPKLNGFGLLKELRADPRTSRLPVIMLSARAGEESRIEGVQAGADDYLVKPFSARELLARVSAHLQMARLRREANEEVRRSEERFRALVQASSDAVYRMSADWTEMRHLQGREFIADTTEPSRSWLEKYIHPDDQPHVLEVIREAIRSKSVFALEHRVRRADDTLGWTFSRAVPLLDSVGDVIEWFGMASDVTARKEAEEALQQERDRLRVTLASIGDAVITTDTEGRVTFLNGVAESVTGWANADAAGQPLETVFNIVNEATRRPVESPATRALREGVIVGLANHTVLIRTDGTELPIDDSAAPVRDGEGHVVGCVLVFRDVTERRGLEKQIAEEGEAARKLAAIVDSSEDAIVSKTLDGVIQSWNAAAERIFGYTAEEAVGRPITMLFSADRLGEEESIMGRIRAGERVEHFDTVRLRKDGTAIPVSLTISPVRDAQGRIVGASKIARDITERKRLEDELRQVAADLSDANRKKDEFLATLAHELRNPLAPLRNALQILRLSPDREAGEQARGMMERQLGQMVRLVDDLMDVSRITRGKVELKKERVQLSAVVNGAVETSRPLVEQMGHELTVTLPKHPVVVDADPARLAQVFANLLNNAAKYTDRGGHISLTAERQGGDVVVAVRDTGIGIPADKLTSIFDMFSQVDRSLEKAQGGLGIGLTLVKRLVEMHGGRVEARSEGAGRGSEFVVRLPIVVDASVPPEDREEPAVPKSSLRILIVDDNEDGADSLADVLRLMGNDTATAYDGQEGVDAAGRLRPDVILFDIGLPRLNGYEAARRIRGEPWGKHPVLIAVTGWGQDEDRRRSREAGFDHHMVKPVDPNALMKLLAELPAAKG